MSLDLDQIMCDWECAAGEISARSVQGVDGREVLQLRIELGVLQMFLDGRPDGVRYHDLPSAFDFVARARRAGDEVSDTDVRELEREITQYNYRRLALAVIAEDALRREEHDHAGRQLMRAVRDIDQCLRRIGVVDELRQRGREQVGLRPTLLFNRGRLASQLRIVQGRYDEAISEAERAAGTLEELLQSVGLDSEQCDDDPGIQYLRQLAVRLRKQYAIPQTLQEQLDAAIENEDFETAARLRERIRSGRAAIRPPAADLDVPREEFAPTDAEFFSEYGDDCDDDGGSYGGDDDEGR